MMKAIGAADLVTSIVRSVTAKMLPPTKPPIPIDSVDKVPTCALSAMGRSRCFHRSLQ